ncbi:MAG: HIT family protein [Endomicrobiia bacterium]
MEILFAPWRINFVKQCKKKGCIFCDKIKSKDDKKNYVLYRGKYSFVILNLYPYTNGHLMVAPYKHIDDLNDLSSEELYELFDLVRKMVKILKTTHNIDGCNIGINLGKAAGAGVEKHLHIHIVPRWFGDTNFLPIIGKTKVIPESLDNTYDFLIKEVKKL